MNKFGSDNLPAFICSHIFNDTKPILLVCHEGDDWQFLCGGHHDIDEKPTIVCVSHLVEQDPSLSEIADLPNGWEAERSEKGGEWFRSKYGEETNN
ncbi:MAG: hypothetical protein GY705_14895 [Bacteroidetes bacterium]|nr:hypothetical protein [Bacteroidota bacterium]